MAEIDVVYIKAKLSEHSGVKEDVVRMTNPEDPLAALIDDAALGYCFDLANNEFQDISGSKPDDEYKHDIKGMVELTMGQLFYWMHDPKYSALHHDIGAKMAARAGLRKAHTKPKASESRKSKYSKASESKGLMPRSGDSTDYDY